MLFVNFFYQNVIVMKMAQSMSCAMKQAVNVPAKKMLLETSVPNVPLNSGELFQTAKVSTSLIKNGQVFWCSCAQRLNLQVFCLVSFIRVNIKLLNPTSVKCVQKSIQISKRNLMIVRPFENWIDFYKPIQLMRKPGF